MKVRYTRRALADLRDIVSYIATENPEAATRARRRISSTIELLSTRPFIGTKNARARELRSCLVPGYPYRVHYLLRDNELLIIHIRHTARRPWEPPRQS